MNMRDRQYKNYAHKYELDAFVFEDNNPKLTPIHHYQQFQSSCCLQFAHNAVNSYIFGLIRF
ncbi:hypothetical protein ES703_89904 [subsurface metagenome]